MAMQTVDIEGWLIELTDRLSLQRVVEHIDKHASGLTDTAIKLYASEFGPFKRLEDFSKMGYLPA